MRDDRLITSSAYAPSLVRFVRAASGAVSKAKRHYNRMDMEESRGEELALSCAQKFCCRTLDCAIVGQSNFFGHCPMKAVAISSDLPSSVLCACWNA